MELAQLSQLSGEAFWLPVVFLGLVGFAFFMYAILDGYDLGVGILLPLNEQAARDTMIASIGPFWDANETWLVLGIGLLLIAFPKAYSLVLLEMYIPVTIMLAGLILRGVAFDFRTKATAGHRQLWDRVFKFGSLAVCLSQGYMMGRFVMAFADGPLAYGFAVLSAVCVTAAYSFVGSAWLVLKTEGALQKRAVKWLRRCTWLTALGLIAVSLVNPWVNPDIFARWFAGPIVLVLMVIPLFCGVLLFAVDRYCKHYPYREDFGNWIPMCAAVIVFMLSFIGLAYSFFPYIVPGKIDVWSAASAPESLRFVLIGTAIVLPTIILYTVFAYFVFRGKTTSLSYY